MSNNEQDIYVIGLCELASKSASCTLDTLQEILDDMNETSKKLDGNDDVGRKILCNTIAIMSDSASTEKLFNQKLEDLRNKVLLEVTEKWDEMSEEAQKDLSQMLHLFCNLHVMVNLAVQYTTVLNQWQRVKGLSIGSELDSAVKKMCRTSEPAVIRLIRNSCKIFARGGSEQTVCHRDMKVFLQTKGFNHTLTPFKGNRFNILFFNAEQVFLIHDFIKEFLYDVHGTNNDVQCSVLADMQDHLNLAAMKALGLISKLVTAPFWILVEKKGNILI
ncbi:hypothetical protein ACJMK2_032621 [Sinanodonta woodiana]|uniref:Uncharacterized protein n=1 Tax=Sinanodonta woodiana TaxID=1069815 RepID=A0ABD3X2V8_SINWO